MPRDNRTYITLHDGMPSNKKIRPLSDKAFRTLVEIWCWCSTERSDGQIDAGNFRLFGTAKARGELVKAGLVDVVGDAYLAHDYLEHQRSKAEIEALSAARARAGSAGGKAKANGVASATRSSGKTEPESESESETDDLTETNESSHVLNAGVPTDEMSPIMAKIAGQAGLTSVPAIVEQIRKHTGRDVTADRAVHIAGWVLEKAKTTPRAPQRYVFTAISQSPHEVAQYIDESGLAS